VDTYVEKETGGIHDYGVQVYFPYEDALDFIDRFNVTLVPGLTPRGSTNTRYVDFSTGKELQSFQDTSSATGINAVRKFHDLALANGYDKMTQPGYWNLPPGHEIPEDLLLPIGEFVKKYDLEPMLALMYPSTGGGAGSRGNFTNIMTLTIMKSFPTAWVKVFFGEIGMYHIQNGNQELYDKIAGLLSDDVLYNTMVVDSERNADGVKLVVEGKAGQKLILAKKLLLAVQPTRENLRPFDLDDHETTLFSKPKYGRSHTGIASHSKFPNGTELRNMPSSAVQDPLSPFLDTPFVLSFSSYGGDSRLFSLGASGSDFNAFDVEAAQQLARDSLQRMADAGTLPDLKGEPVDFVAWSDHEVGGFGVSPEDMRNGWMADLYALQGKRSTWFTGGGVAVDFSPVLWKFNDDLLPRIVKDM
jgi:hypothetical protein